MSEESKFTDVGFPPRPPYIYQTFITDIFAHVEQRQEGHHCADFELRLADCLEAYGFPKSEKKCAPYLRDLRECVFNAKQQYRCKVMKWERDRQFKAGERKKRFEDPPPIHGF